MNPSPPIPAPEGEVPPRLIVPRAEVYAEGGFGTYFAVWTPQDPFLVSPTEDIEYICEQEVEQLLSAEKQRGLRAVGEARRDAFTECGVCYDCGEELDDLCDCAECAAKEPS